MEHTGSRVATSVASPPPQKRYRSGTIAIAQMCHPALGRLDHKPRPVVLIAPRGESQWMVMGLTTNSHFANGEPRPLVTSWEKLGLQKPGYLWGNRLVAISTMDIHRVIGMADAELMRAIEQQLRMGVPVPS